ncbi:multidrug effflux MFS transporter [Pseudooceanicola nanhaiensis]|uniref:multidrug effflux MFS transporter n=1 Tax=Pseudooceanicola nanhaiensis TaxID=375761 RepID=UPI001CD4EBCF|nr:multidrug effflux MFS transporter [Pseudooceanicola nanhaiensis]MCA0921307.1 multidrug effflux MFS transporter [Pseudooceanicola nanhaiensis]
MPHASSRSAAPPAPLPVIAILVLALLSAVAPLATDMYLPGFPVMTEDLATGASTVQLTLTGFMVGLALGQLFIGPLSDSFGRRRPLLLGTALAVVAGLACAMAPNVETLIALRLLQGFGGAAGVVIARAIISDRTTDAGASARLMQIMMMIGGLAPVLAPIIGTGIVSLAGWRAVFVVTAILSAVSFFGVFTKVTESLPAENRTPGGARALWTGIGTVITNRSYLGYTLTVGFAFAVMFAYISASPFVFQGILGLSPVQYSLAFGSNAIGIVVVSAVSAKIVGRVAPQRLAAIGLTTMSCGALAVMACVLAGAGAALMLPSIFCTVASLGLILGNVSALAISQTPRTAGTASALLGALQFCLGAVASPLVGLAGEGTALPMACVMIVAAVLAVGSFLLLTPRSPAAQAAAEAA